MQDVHHIQPLIGFGLGRLHHVLSRRQRERIVKGAVDAGLTHLDLAPAYGDGLCEAETGRILKGRRTQVSLATKFGIPAGALGGRNITFYFASKFLRRTFSPSYGGEYGLRDFSAETAIRSVEQSLRRLRTDYLDCLFFHEPRGLADLPAVLETVDAMERLKRDGKVLRFGVSASTDYFLTCGAGSMVGDMVQFEVADTSPSLVDRIAKGKRTSAFGLLRFLIGHGEVPPPGGRLDYGRVIEWFFGRYPATMPILASNRPDEIARLGRAVHDLPAGLAAGCGGLQQTPTIPFRARRLQQQRNGPDAPLAQLR